jgi:protein-disulfide isomerase
MSRAERRHPQKKSSSWKLWLAVAIIVLLIAGAFWYQNNRGTGVDYTQYNYSDEKFARPNATRVVQDFSDFECPACRSFSPAFKLFRDTAPDYVRVEYKHFPLRSIHPYAQKAAEASECAREQGRFWAYHDVLMDYENLDKRTLRKHAEGLSLDMGAWNACFEGGKAQAAVQREYLEGQQRGVKGTPTVLVDDKVVQARTVLELQRLVETS